MSTFRKDVDAESCGMLIRTASLLYMVTMEHELPLKLIDDRPDLAVNLARECGLDLPAHVIPEVVSADLPDSPR